MSKAKKRLHEYQCSYCMRARRLSGGVYCTSCNDIYNALDEHDERRIVFQYAQLVWKLAGKAANRRTGKALGEVEDLFQQGCIGLLKGIRMFDPTKGIKPLTYYYACIWGHLRAESDRNNGLIRVPADLLKCKPPDDDNWRERFRFAAKALGITNFVTNSEFSTAAEDNLPAPEAESANGSDEIAMLHDGLLWLDDRQATILKKRYGIGCKAPMTLNEIAIEFNLTKERIRQIEVQALTRLRILMLARAKAA